MSIVLFGAVSRLYVSNEPVRSKVATSSEEDIKRMEFVELVAIPFRTADVAAADEDATTDRLSSIDAALVANMMYYFILLC